MNLTKNPNVKIACMYSTFGNVVTNKIIPAILICISMIYADKPNDWMHFYYNGLDSDWLCGGFAEDLNGNIWVGGSPIYHMGIMFLSAEDILNCTTKLTKKKQTSTDVNEILTHTNGDVWIFCEDSFFVYNPINPDSLFIASDYGEERLWGIRAIEMANGDICLGAANKRVYTIEHGSKQIEPFNVPDINYPIYPDYVDTKGNIWFYGKGLYKYNGATWTHFTRENSGLLSNSFHIEGRKIVESSNGNIIAATRDEGLFIYRDSNWVTYARPLPNEGSKRISNIAIDSNGVLWVDFGYIGYYREGEWYTYTEGDFSAYRAPVGYSMSEIMADGNNKVWFAGRHRGLYMLNQGTEQSCINVKRLEITTPNTSTVWDTSENNVIEWKTWGYVYSVNLRYEVKENDQWKAILYNDKPLENAGSASWRTPITSSNRYRIRIFSIDDSTIADTTEFFTIAAEGQNLPPNLQNTPDTLYADTDQTTSWTAEATDGNDDPITFSFTALPSWATASQATLTLNPDEDSENTTILVIAADTNGGADTAEIYLEVSLPSARDITIGHTNQKENILHLGNRKVNLPAGKIRNVTVFNMQGKVIAKTAAQTGYQNLFRAGKNINESFVVIKVDFADNSSIQKKICLVE